MAYQQEVPFKRARVQVPDAHPSCADIAFVLLSY